MQESSMTSKGQITIPAVVRKKMGLETGDRLSFIEDDDGNFILRAKKYSLTDFDKVLPMPSKAASLEDIESAIQKGWSGERDA